MIYFLAPLFVVGYLFIAIEHWTKVNKANISLLMAVLCWLCFFAGSPLGHEEKVHQLLHHLAATSQIVFFLLGAMAIVEIIHSYDGFVLLSDHLLATSKKELFFVLGPIAFFLSAVIGNLTATVVMISLLRRFLPEGEERLYFGGMVVVAANAGGAWAPVGDITTTMLWIGGQVTAWGVVQALFLPSLCCLGVPLVWMGRHIRGQLPLRQESTERRDPWYRLVFWLGTALLISVPVIRLTTGLPPFLAMFLGLAILWVVTDLLHRGKHHAYDQKVSAILARIDHSTILFFLGILLAVNALESAGLLTALAQGMDSVFHYPMVIATVIGIISAIIDNVPLVAAAMGMYPMDRYGQDDPFWHLIAYCAGTGGSLLVVGSAAGLAFMGMEKAHFFWYIKRIALPAALGYFSGIGFFYLSQRLG